MLAIKGNKSFQVDPLLGKSQPEPEKPPRFPMKFRQFLRRMFGGRLHNERLRLYRKYLYQSLQVSEHFKGGHSSIKARDAAAERERDVIIEKQTKNGIEDLNWYLTLKYDIERWRSLNRINQRREANKSRWLKEKSKKSVDATTPSNS